MMRIPSLLRRAFPAVFIVAASLQPSQGASKRVIVSDETCNYALTYDPAKTGETQIKDTFEFLLLPGWTTVFGHSVFSADAIKSIDLGKIDEQCAASLTKVKSLKLLPIDAVEARRNATIAEIEDSCRYDRLDSEGFRNPAALRNYTKASACFRYVDALEDKSDLTAMYDEVGRDQCKRSGNVKNCLGDLRKNRGNVAEMKVYVQNFGWNHCAIAFNLRNTEQNNEKAQTLAHALMKQFKGRKTTCDEP